MTQPNPSTAQARTIVDELHRHGADYVVISPGSRSAALAIAFDQHPGITTRVVLDERSAAFHALGRAGATGAPAVAVCTSGTALANFLPAVVEADLSHVPLILISADRPPELLHVGANQTIDQVGIFGERARWTCTISPAESVRDGNAYWRTTVSQAVARAVGHAGRPGPVHLNIAFREPTVPVGDDGRSSAEPYPFSIEGRLGGRVWQRHDRAHPGGLPMSGADGKRGIVLAGYGDFDAPALKGAADRLNWPVLGTAQSGLRTTDVVTTYHHILAGGVPASLLPDVVVTVGKVGPSDRLGALTGLDVPQIHIDPWGTWNDPRRHVTSMLQADPVATLRSVVPADDDGFAVSWAEADSRMRRALDEALAMYEAPTGPSLARALSGAEIGQLVAASSMPIRDVDGHTSRVGRVIANRGASGIDGFVSVALGVSSAVTRTVALSGDLSLLHDASGFVVDPQGDAVFVVVDNGGGGLFDLLPQAEHAPGFDRLFVTPHGLDLVRLGEAYGALTVVVDDVGTLARSVTSRAEAGGIHIVVVPVDREIDLKVRRALDEVAGEVCSGLS